MPRLAVLKNTYLPVSETFVHEQLRTLSRYEPLLLVRELANTDRFPPQWPVQSLPTFPQRLLYMLRGRSPLLEKSARAYAPQLVHAHFAVDGVYALELARRLQVPLVVTLHAYDIVKLPRVPSRHLAWWRHALRWRRLQAEAAAFVVISEAMRQAAIEKGYPENRIHLIRLGVDLQRFCRENPAGDESKDRSEDASNVDANAVGRPQAELPNRDPEGDSSRPLRILHVGRLVPKKALGTLLDALGRTAGNGAGFHLTVIGDGPLRERLNEQAGSLGAKVEFLGARSSDDVRSAMADADVFCLPSETVEDGDMEGLPVVLMEAAAMGLPLVGTDHSGIGEIVIHEETGLLVPERAPQELANALEKLSKDPSLRKRLAQGARAKVEAEFDLRTQVGKLEELFDRVVEEGLVPR